MQMVILSVSSSTKQVASMPSSVDTRVDTRVDLDVAGALGASLPPWLRSGEKVGIWGPPVMLIGLDSPQQL